MVINTRQPCLISVVLLPFLLMRCVSTQWLGVEVCARSLQSCPTLGDPMDCSPPGSSVHGTLQARMESWVAISFSRGPSPSRDQTPVFCIADGFFTDQATREAQRLCLENHYWAIFWKLTLMQPSRAGIISPGKQD